VQVSGERTLHEIAGVRFGAFRCLPGDWRWTAPNDIGHQAYVVIPKVPVHIEPEGRPSVLATSAEVLFYDRGHRFRRALADPQGDRCLFLAVDEPLTGSGWSQGQLGSRTFALAIGLEHLSVTGGDRLSLDEGVLHLADRLCSEAQVSPPSRVGISATARHHRVLAEDAKAVLAQRVRETVGIEQVALALAVSPFHLCRVFRAQTGYTLHGFQTALRLRMALDRLDAFHGDLAALAVDLGFAHHSHLTHSFRRTFGSTPSDWMSKMVTARA
jgi:AraC-like DNA-binding protein